MEKEKEHTKSESEILLFFPTLLSLFSVLLSPPAALSLSPSLSLYFPTRLISLLPPRHIEDGVVLAKNLLEERDLAPAKASAAARQPRTAPALARRRGPAGEGSAAPAILARLASSERRAPVQAPASLPDPVGEPSWTTEEDADVLVGVRGLDLALFFFLDFFGENKSQARKRKE